MTTIYDPKHPLYTDEADVRAELTRVYDLCHGCRLCFKFCTSFPTLFDMIDRHDDQDAGRLTPAQQDQVVSECFQCKLCYINCPYIPELHEWALDFPRLMLRADAMRHANGHVSQRSKVTNAVMGRTDLMGKAVTIAGPVTDLANRAVNARSGSLVRKAMEKVTGVSAVRLLPPYARQRFSTWFKARPKVRMTRRQGRVAVFPTCLVEYQEPAIGKAMVGVLEHNGFSCSLPEGQVCCGMPWLDAGDTDKFREHAQANVNALLPAVRAGKKIVVPQPTCAYTLKDEYPAFLGTEASREVAAATVMRSCSRPAAGKSRASCARNSRR